jgi:hypothetical protein
MHASISKPSARCSDLRRAAELVCAFALLAPLMPTSAQAHGVDASTASSALSMLPVAVSVVAPVAVLASGAALTVVTVEASARGTVLMLERASDAARMSVELSGRASLAVGTLVTVSVIGSGWVLSQAGKAVLFIPNEIGGSLLYNERVTP